MKSFFRREAPQKPSKPSLVAGPFLVAVDTQEYPGKVHCTYVSFSSELIAWDEFNRHEFRLLDRNNPEVRKLRVLLFGKEPRNG